MGGMVIGIDLGKNSCSVAGMDPDGRVAFRRRASRAGVVALVRKHPPRAASWRWRPAAARTTSGASFPRRATKYG